MKNKIKLEFQEFLKQSFVNFKKYLVFIIYYRCISRITTIKVFNKVKCDTDEIYVALIFLTQVPRYNAVQFVGKYNL